MTAAKFRTTAIVLQPTNPANVPAGSIFKSDAPIANPIQMSTGSGASTDLVQTQVSFVLKRKQAAIAIPAACPVSVLPDNRIVPADSDDAAARQPIGVSLAAIEVDEYGTIVLVGPNVPDMIRGMGFKPGDELYVNAQQGGLTNDPTTLRIGVDQFVKIGLADGPGDTAATDATDLILLLQVLARP
jgi:hypothetical protein